MLAGKLYSPSATMDALLGLPHLFIVFAITITIFIFQLGCVAVVVVVIVTGHGVFGAKIIAKPICGNYLMCSPRWDPAPAPAPGAEAEPGLKVRAVMEWLWNYRYAIAFATQSRSLCQLWQVLWPRSVSPPSVWSIKFCQVDSAMWIGHTHMGPVVLEAFATFPQPLRHN